MTTKQVAFIKEQVKENVYINVREANTMESSNKYNHFRTQVQPALTSKLSEFRLLGYGSVSEEDIWDFLTKKKWKKVKEEIRVYEVIQDILAVKVSDYMNFTTMESYKTAEFSLQDENEWKELLK